LLWIAAPETRAADPVIAAAGDIACSPSSSNYNGGAGTTEKCRQRHTSDLLVNQGLSAVLTLGDAQYSSGSYSSFSKSYHASWGRVKPITFPSAGNHEYLTGGGQGYFDYFNGPGRRTGPAGDRSLGYYSFDIGTWHLIALNSSDHCTLVPCGKGSAQETWLRADLAANPRKCTLAFWHHPRFNSGHDGNATFMQAMFEDLYNADAEVILGGHAHDYERFAPQDPAGKVDNARGIRQFVVGTGGAFFTSVGTAKPNSQIRQASTYGVLMLTLHPASYDWRFVPEAGKTFTDQGTQACHGPGPVLPPEPPDPPAPPRAKDQEWSDSPLAPAVVPLATCTILGTAGDDVLRGTAGEDVICGLDGDDRISAGPGRDRVAGGAGRDRVRGGDDDDLVLGGRGRDRLYGGRGNDILHGNMARDVLRGQSGNDRVVGQGGRNTLFGNIGDDILVASLNRRGGDRVFGGRGLDVAHMNPGDRGRRIERRLPDVQGP
jgi:hypothetical protein